MQSQRMMPGRSVRRQNRPVARGEQLRLKIGWFRHRKVFGCQISNQLDARGNGLRPAAQA